MAWLTYCRVYSLFSCLSLPFLQVNKFVGELKAKYGTICEASKNILDKLDSAMRDHQQYQDAAQDFTDWLNSARERLEACADRSGDKLSLKSKRDRLKVGSHLTGFHHTCSVNLFILKP